MHTLELAAWVGRGIWPYPYHVYEMEYKDACYLDMALQERDAAERRESDKIKKEADSIQKTGVK